MKQGLTGDFPPTLGPFGLNSIHVYDAKTNDVGFGYNGKIASGTARCIATISVYVYPASESISQHLSQVVEAMNLKTPGMTKREAGLEPEAENNQIGQHTAFNSEVNGVPTTEQVSIYERARRFVKYRITMAPRDSAECEEMVRDAFKTLQSPSGPTCPGDRK